MSEINVLLLAVTQGQEPLIRILLEQAVEFNINDYTNPLNEGVLLHKAELHGHKAIVIHCRVKVPVKSICGLGDQIPYSLIYRLGLKDSFVVIGNLPRRVQLPVPVVAGYMRIWTVCWWVAVPR